MATIYSMSVFFVKAYIALIQEQNILYVLKNTSADKTIKKSCSFFFLQDFFEKYSEYINHDQWPDGFFSTMSFSVVRSACRRAAKITAKGISVIQIAFPRKRLQNIVPATAPRRK